MQRHYDRHTAHKLRNKTEFEQVLGEYVFEYRTDVLFHIGLHVCTKAHQFFARSSAYNVLYAAKGAAAYKQYVGGVNLQAFLMRMLPAALRRYACNRTLDYLQKSLLYALARNIPCDGGVFALSCDFVYFVYIDYAMLGTLDIIVRRLYELEKYVFNVLANIAGLRQRRRIRNGKRHIKHLCKRLCKQSFSAARRPKHDYVALLKLHIVRLFLVYALIVVVNRNGKRLFCVTLSDNVLVKHLGNFTGLGNVAYVHFRRRIIVVEYILTKLDALVTYIHPGTRNYTLYFVLLFPAECANYIAVVFIVIFCHTLTTAPHL